ncbi:MAG: D-alanine--D-alanine ligase [Cyanobacteria bacterium]|nr:D-alanine--D-alanine ligase [Cyanobacteriota bacterium]
MDLQIKNAANEFKNLKITSRKKEIKVGVICGGISSEREISLKTGEGIYNALIANGYNAEFIDFKGDNIFVFNKIDIAFLALHGKYGEDGSVQGVLELFKIPYTGSGILASSLAIDKIFSKKVFVLEGIPTPDYIGIDAVGELDFDEIKKDTGNLLGYPLIVKPAREGSTIGVTIVENESEIESAINFARIYDSKILVEKFISGRQLTVSLIGKKPFVLPIIEIKPKSGFYDFKSKYTAGMTEYIVPVMLDKEIENKINELSVKAHNSLDCYGVSRVDLILNENNKPFFLEINTMPGMTSTSLVPKAAAAAGIKFEKLVEIILDCANLKM